MKLWPTSRWRQGLLASLLLGGLTVVGLNAYVYLVGRSLMVPLEEAGPADAILVPGAFVYENGGVCPILQDRLDMGLKLYRAGKAPKLLLSGDHGQPDYDEVNAMRAYLESRGVPPQDLFLDHAGFTTYDSMARAKRVFQARSLLLVTQSFHLTRALYIGRGLGLQVQGVASDQRHYFDQHYYQLRECGARLKAFAEVTRQKDPDLLGPEIPLSGDGRVTHDKLASTKS